MAGGLDVCWCFGRRNRRLDSVDLEIHLDWSVNLQNHVRDTRFAVSLDGKSGHGAKVVHALGEMKHFETVELERELCQPNVRVTTMKSDRGLAWGGREQASGVQRTTVL